MPVESNLSEGNANPFMMTSYQRGVGLSLAELKRAARQIEDQRANENEEPKTPAYDLSFLYSKSSEAVGAGIPYSDSALSKALRQKESLITEAKRRTLPAELIKTQEKDEVKRHFTTEEVQEILKSYTHEAKVQHPLYSTSSYEYGRKKLTPASFTSTRLSKQQAFSSSFNGEMQRYKGLNTSISRSKVHSLLDP